MSTDTSRMAEHASVSIARASEWIAADGIPHRFAPDLGQPTHEPVRIRTLVRVDKYHDENDEIARLLRLGLAAPKPYEIVESEGNLLTTNGGNSLWTGFGTGTLATPFNTTNAQLVVGDNSTAPAAGNTDLSAAVGTTQNLSSSTNATPIVLTLATPLSPAPVAGQTVVVSGHGVNTNANQTWEVGTVTSTTVFALLNSVGNGVGTATGTVAPINKYAMRANGSGSAVITTNSIVYVAVFATANANFAWLEWGLRLGAQITNMQAAPPSTLFNRAIPSLGTKTNSATWTLTVTLTLA
jgi:hypothetical protein